MSTSHKIVMLGHFGVGKTSLIRRFVESEFDENYIVTVGVHVSKKVVQLGENNVTLIIWDLEGNKSISKARSSYLLGTNWFMYVFDLTRNETYKNLSEELSFLKSNFPKVPYSIIGNKSDLVEKSEIETLIEQHKDLKSAHFTSAKTGDGVEDVFKEIAKNVTEK